MGRFLGIIFLLALSQPALASGYAIDCVSSVSPDGNHFSLQASFSHPNIMSEGNLDMTLGLMRLIRVKNQPALRGPDGYAVSFDDYFCSYNFVLPDSFDPSFTTRLITRCEGMTARNYTLQCKTTPVCSSDFQKN